MSRPPSGTMCYWRFKGMLQWNFGYCTYVSGYDVLRMGRWNGDIHGGAVVNASDIEWRSYT